MDPTPVSVIEPLAAPGWSGEWPERQVSRAVWSFVVVGVVLRVVRYAMNQPLWGDEAFLAASFLDRGYVDLLQPLEYHQVAPLLFLWTERTAVLANRLFGMVIAAGSTDLRRGECRCLPSLRARF